MERYIHTYIHTYIQTKWHGFFFSAYAIISFALRARNKIKSLMRLEPWPSSLSCQRYNQKSIYCLLIRSIIKVNKIIFVLAATHIFCVIFKTKKSEICCESVIHTFLHRLFVLKRDFLSQFNILASYLRLVWSTHIFQFLHIKFNNWI